MSKPIQLSNGSLLFPKDPPINVPGFYRDELNKKLFRPDLDDCKHRITKTFIKPCKKIGVSYWCTHLCRDVSPLFCNNCSVEPKT